MNLGPYERNCRAHWVGHNDPMPDDFSFQLFPDDLERLEHYLDDAVAPRADPRHGRPVQGHQRADPLCARRQPADRPDARRAQRLRGLRLHLRHRPGRRRRQGAGRMGDARARPSGTCGPAIRAASPPSPPAPDYCVAKGMEIYGNEYAIQFPAPRLAGRPRPQAVADPRPHRGAGRQFNAYNGWERATWYAQPGDDVSEASTQTFRRDGPWQQRIREECLAVRDAAGILDLPGFSRFRLQGAGARRLAGAADHRPRAEARPHRPRLFRRRHGPHRHRNVDHGAAPRICSS